MGIVIIITLVEDYIYSSKQKTKEPKLIVISNNHIISDKVSGLDKLKF